MVLSLNDCFKDVDTFYCNSVFFSMVTIIVYQFRFLAVRWLWRCWVVGQLTELMRAWGIRIWNNNQRHSGGPANRKQDAEWPEQNWRGCCCLSAMWVPSPLLLTVLPSRISRKSVWLLGHGISPSLATPWERRRRIWHLCFLSWKR